MKIDKIIVLYQPYFNHDPGYKTGNFLFYCTQFIRTSFTAVRRGIFYIFLAFSAAGNSLSTFISPLHISHRKLHFFTQFHSHKISTNTQPIRFSHASLLINPTHTKTFHFQPTSGLSTHCIEENKKNKRS